MQHGQTVRVYYVSFSILRKMHTAIYAEASSLLSFIENV